MKKTSLHLIPILALLLSITFFFVTPAQAAVNYSNSNATFTFSFDNNQDDFGSCATTTYWKISLSYNGGTTAQGSVRSSDTHSGTDTFSSIPNGTSIQSIKLITAFSPDQANETDGCVYEIANNSGGIFTWQADTSPVISDIVVSNVTSSSVTVSWTTDQNGTSVVDYGTTSSYGSTQSDSTSTTSHSVSLSGLSANVTYHYKVSSVGSGGTGSSGDNTFATPQTGTTGTTQTGTSTTTRTRIITPTPTPTPVPDRTPPAVSIETDFSKPFTKPPTISGKASDASGISKVEYSTDDGRNWNAVDEIPNIGANFVTFTFTPPPLDDDNYQIRVRATDNSPAHNTRDSDASTMIIDRLPPRIGGTIIAIGPQILYPDDAGYLHTTKGIPQKMTLSAVGGPTQITITASHPGETNAIKTYTLSRNSDNGLWSTTLIFDTPGIYQLTGKSVDGAGNTTERVLNNIAVLEPGKILTPNNEPIANAKITLYYFENKYQLWRVWDGPSYNQKNPVQTTNEGEFSYLVPSGKYYVDIQAPGFAHTESAIFTVDGPTILNPTFSPKPLKILLDLWLFKIYFPDFSIATIPVTISVPPVPQTTDGLIGKDAPAITLPTTDGNQFDLSNTRGTPRVLTFLNLWSPQTNEQILALDRLQGSNFKYTAIMVGESLTKTQTIQQRGEYKTTFVVDSDAKLVDPYQLNTLPTSYFLDRHGAIQKIITGVLSDKEIKDILIGMQ